MPIRSYLANDAVFDDVAVGAMSRALEKACAELKVFAADLAGRQIIAARIIDLARSGVLDADALAKRVIDEGRLSL